MPHLSTNDRVLLLLAERDWRTLVLAGDACIDRFPDDYVRAVVRNDHLEIEVARDLPNGDQHIVRICDTSDVTDDLAEERWRVHDPQVSIGGYWTFSGENFHLAIRQIADLLHDAVVTT